MGIFFFFFAFFLYDSADIGGIIFVCFVVYIAIIVYFSCYFFPNVAVNRYTDHSWASVIGPVPV